MADGGIGTGDALLFGVACDLSYTVWSATCSSPQTTELFAKDRAATLWKYVRLGALQTAVLVGIMALSAARDGGMRRAAWPLAGGTLVGAGMWWMYGNALKSGGA